MPSTRQVISDAQIAGAAKGAGFSGNNLVIAVAVALAESGGNTRAHNPRGLDNSYGLWQINMLGQMGVERRKAFGIRSNEELWDPNVNARAAKKIHSWQGWSGWTTYTSGRYRIYLNRARKAAGNPSAASGGAVDAQQAGLIPGLNEISLFFEIISDGGVWIRIGMFVAGGILLLLGLFQLSGQAGKAKMLLDFIPGGKVAKKAVK